jgi:hypothetical protein
MNQSTASVRSPCLAPARVNLAIDAPLGPTPYARMFPELPSFQADEEFLHEKLGYKKTPRRVYGPGFEPKTRPSAAVEMTV